MCLNLTPVSGVRDDAAMPTGRGPADPRMPFDAAAPGPDFDREGDCYRRRIVCEAVAPGVVVTDLEDDFHHFRVTVGHDGVRVRSIDCESLRWPWSTCPEAARNLAPLVGAPLPRRFTDVADVADPRANCSHQFDAAGHALRHAHRVSGRSQGPAAAAARVFDVEVRLPDDGTTARARLWVDGVPALTWRLAGHLIVAAEPPFDRAPRSGFMRWADAELDAETAEAGIVLRRGATIAIGRGWPFDDFDHAGQVQIGQSSVCYTMTPGRSTTALRVRGSVRDFAAAPERLVRPRGERPTEVDSAPGRRGD